jgi:hypothetical protein
MVPVPVLMWRSRYVYGQLLPRLGMGMCLGGGLSVLVAATAMRGGGGGAVAAVVARLGRVRFHGAYGRGPASPGALVVGRGEWLPDASMPGRAMPLRWVSGGQGRSRRQGWRSARWGTPRCAAATVSALLPNTVFSHTVPCMWCTHVVHHMALCCVCVMAVSPSAETAFQDAGERPFRQTEWWLKPSKSFIVVSGAMGGYPASAWFCKPSCLILSVSRLTLSVSCRVLSVSCLVYHMQSHIFCSQSTTSPPAPPPPERSARPLRCAPTPGA